MNDYRMPSTITINEIKTWYENGELSLQPAYQRNRVWSESARSYLIDSIIRNYPIPPIFIREKLDLKDRKTIREVVDGQQRITAMMDFYNNKLKIMPLHNKDFANKSFDDLNEREQLDFLTYKITVERIVENDDAIIFDMFARLNSNNITLNAQELRNAKYTGEFKVVAYELAKNFRDLFSNYNIFSTSQMARMADVEYISLLMLEFDKGVIEGKKTVIDNYYAENNKQYILAQEVKAYMHWLLRELNLLLPKLENSRNKFFSPLYLYDLINFLKTYYKTVKQINYDSIAHSVNLINGLLQNGVFDYYSFENYEDMLVNKLARYKELHTRRTTDKTCKMERIKLLKEWIKV